MSVFIESFLSENEHACLDYATTHGIIDWIQHGPQLRMNRRKYPMLQVVSGGRCGSTFMFRVLKKLFNLNSVKFHNAFFNHENDLSLFHVLVHHKSRCINLAHMKASPNNIALCNYFGIKTVIMIRDIYHTIISCAKVVQLAKEEDQNFELGFASAAPGWFDGENQLKLSNEEALDFSIDILTPWYLDFYKSWQDIYLSQSSDCIWINHYDFKNDMKNTISKIVDFCKLKTFFSDWDHLEDKFPYEQEPYSNKSHILPTREWLKLFNHDRINRVKSFLNLYPDLDLTLMGKSPL